MILDGVVEDEGGHRMDTEVRMTSLMERHNGMAPAKYNVDAKPGVNPPGNENEHMPRHM